MENTDNKRGKGTLDIPVVLQTKNDAETMAERLPTMEEEKC